MTCDMVRGYVEQNIDKLYKNRKSNSIQKLEKLAGMSLEKSSKTNELSKSFRQQPLTEAQEFRQKQKYCEMLLAYAELTMKQRTMRKRHKSLNGIKEKDSNPFYSYETKNFFMEEGIENVQRSLEFCGHRAKVPTEFIPLEKI